MKKIILSTLCLLCFWSCEYDKMGDIGDIGFGLIGEQYNTFEENPFVETSQNNVSTFAIDADGASYANTRRFLSYNQKPPKDAVRIEEFINYFQHNYPEPTGQHPIFVDGEVGQCPWTATNKLIRIGIKGKSIPKADLPSSNITLLIDVSGSMGSSDKLPLLKQTLMFFVDELRPQDKIAIVTYAGQNTVALPATSGSEKNAIKSAINSLGSGGSTNGSGGIIKAYEIAQQNFVQGGNNRVILATDGDFNVGVTSQDELVKLIESKRDAGVFLTVLGMGIGNLNDGAMEQLANKGNGIYEYIDNLEQGKKVFVYEFNKFFTIAQDVKVQVKFNPTLVKAYRLIGYENRLLQQQDFNNDKKDAGDLSVGQTVSALYEIVPQTTIGLDFQSTPTFTIDFRYKIPTETNSHLISIPVPDGLIPFENTSENFRFISAVASYGMLLRNSAYKGNTNYDIVQNWVSNSKQYDPYNFRNEFLTLIQKTKTLP